MLQQKINPIKTGFIQNVSWHKKMTMEETFNFIDDIITEEDDSQLDSYQIEEYDLTSTPNDFNVLTINSFIQSVVTNIC